MIPISRAYYLWALLSAIAVTAPLFFISLPPSCSFVFELGPDAIYKERNPILEGGAFLGISIIAFGFWLLVRSIFKRLVPDAHTLLTAVLYVVVVACSAVIFAARYFSAFSIYFLPGCSQAGGVEIDSGFGLFMEIHMQLARVLCFGAAAGVVTIIAARRP